MCRTCPADLAVGAFVVAGGALVMCPVWSAVRNRFRLLAERARSGLRRGTVGPDVLVGDNEVRPPGLGSLPAASGFARLRPDKHAGKTGFRGDGWSGCGGGDGRDGGRVVAGVAEKVRKGVAARMGRRVRPRADSPRR